MPYHYIRYNGDPIPPLYRIIVIPNLAVLHQFDFARWRKDQYGEGFDRITVMPYHYIRFNSDPVEWWYGINVMPYSYMVDQG
jgi:hypothetical protein